MNNKTVASVKVARVPHMAQKNLAKALMAEDGDNILGQLKEEVRREVCENLRVNDSTFSLARISMYINSRVQ